MMRSPGRKCTEGIENYAFPQILSRPHSLCFKMGGAMNKLNALVLILAVFLGICLVSGKVAAEQMDCKMCHEDLIKQKTVHAAVQMGCESCHSGIDATDIPHKKTNNKDKGLSAEQPALCYGCHDQSVFSQKVVHSALHMGCSSCHNPHSTNTEKLLMAELPALCFNCHDKAKFDGEFSHAPVTIGLCSTCHSPHSSGNEKLFTKKVPELCFDCHDKAEFTRKLIHQPVGGGMCSQCHKPHASENFALLTKRGNSVCFECHPTVRKAPHAIIGFTTRGHPLGGVKFVRDRQGKKKKRTVNDPKRPGKIFYCGSCHDPHSSESPSLFRYEARSVMGLCSYCHKM